MSLTNAGETSVLLLMFNNTNWANIGDATGLRGSTTAGDWWISLHTADPGEAGTQLTNEVSYTGYGRVAVARTGAGWVVTGASVSPASAVTFGACTAGTATATHMGIGTASSGAGVLVFKGALSPTIAIAAGVTPQLLAATAVTVD